MVNTKENSWNDSDEATVYRGESLLPQISKVTMEWKNLLKHFIGA